MLKVKLDLFGNGKPTGKEAPKAPPAKTPPTTPPVTPPVAPPVMAPTGPDMAAIQAQIDTMLKAAQSKVDDMLSTAKEEAAEIVSSAIDTINVERVPETVDEKAAFEAYQNERVSIKLFKDTDRYKDDVLLILNGERCLIQRGVYVTIKRKFLEVIDVSEMQDAQTASLIEGFQADFEKKRKDFE